MSGGPLTGVKVLEFGGIGPGPFCGMLLCDLGAEVVRIDRPGATAAHPQIAHRGRQSLVLDLKKASAVDACLQLIERAALLFEGYRPGVMERLGLGPSVALGRNPRLIYGRMTGWGQAGPYACAAGHDINYIAISGALHAIGAAERPAPPLNLLGDYGGGALYLAFGLLAGLVHARSTGVGQVVDVAMSDGAASLMATIYGRFAYGHWRNDRESNLLDGAAPFYGVYRCADGKWVAVGALEPQFYAVLRERTGATGRVFDNQHERCLWPEQRRRFAELFAKRTRQEWIERFAGADGCLSPVLDLEEAPRDAHNQARDAFIVVDGVTQPAPAPRFSQTPGKVRSGPPLPGAHSRTVLESWGLDEQTITVALAND